MEARIISKIKDITGQEFGRLTEIEICPDYKNNKTTYWKCKCDCGGYFHNNKKQKTWICKCSCGKQTIKDIKGSVLKRGKSKSCGCLYDLKYDLSGDCGIGYTLKDEKFYFDLDDYDLIKDYDWRLDKDGYVVANIKINNKKTTIKMHRIIMNVKNREDLIDHIHHIEHDNRKSQLRIVNTSQNNMNQKLSKINTSGHKGVSWNKEKNKYEAYITQNRKRKNLGYYNNIEDAIKIREKYEKEMFGEYSFDYGNSNQLLM